MHDRGLLYGQSVFETIAVYRQQPLLLDAHIQRLQRGCEVLSIEFDEATLLQEIGRLCEAIQLAVLRVMVSMGEGGRGYLNPSPARPNRIITTHDYPQHPQAYRDRGVVLGLSEFRLARQPALAGIKHGNRLEQIMARSDWQPEWQEAVLVDQMDNVIEATQANIFVRHGDQLLTPILDQAGVAGVMREYILQSADKVGVSAEAVPLSIADIESAEEVFLSNCIIGLWPVRQFQKTTFNDFSISHKFFELMQRDGAIPTF